MATRGTKSKKVETVEVQATLDAVKNLDTSKVVAEVNNLQVTLQTTLADVSAAIVGKIQQIDTINDAIRLKQERLKELFSIEAEAISIDDLKAQREAEKEAWLRDAEVREQDLAEETAERAKQRTRTEEEWAYAFERKKAREEAVLKLSIEDTQRKEKIRQVDLDKSWNDREASLKASEAEFTELKKQVEGFDARLKASVKEAEAILSNTLKKQHEHEKELLLRDAKSAEAVFNTRMEAIQSGNRSYEAQIADLKSQLAAAHQSSKEIATSALQAGSDRKVADALRQVVDGRDNQQTRGQK